MQYQYSVCTWSALWADKYRQCLSIKPMFDWKKKIEKLDLQASWPLPEILAAHRYAVLFVMLEFHHEAFHVLGCHCAASLIAREWPIPQWKLQCVLSVSCICKPNLS